MYLAIGSLCSNYGRHHYSSHIFPLASPHSYHRIKQRCFEAGQPCGWHCLRKCEQSSLLEPLSPPVPSGEPQSMGLQCQDSTGPSPGHRWGEHSASTSQLGHRCWTRYPHGPLSHTQWRGRGGDIVCNCRHAWAVLTSQLKIENNKKTCFVYVLSYYWQQFCQLVLPVLL